MNNKSFLQRKHIRLRGYDYSRAGLYFITVVCQNRTNRFGEIVPNSDGRAEMVLNAPGNMVAEWYYELENKYPDKRCHEMVIMPNHVHFIIENVADGMVADAHVGAPLRGRPHEKTPIPNRPDHPNKKTNATIGDAMDWFKTMTTNAYIRGVKQNGWPRFDKKLWQRKYYDHIIRNEQSYNTISDYIRDNPQKWLDDKFYKE